MTEITAAPVATEPAALTKTIARTPSGREAMMPLWDAEMEAFCREVADGETASTAARAVWPNASAYVRRKKTAAIMRLPEAKERIAELNHHYEDYVKERHNFSKNNMLDFLISVMETPVGELTEDSPLTQSYEQEELLRKDGTPRGTVTRVKGVSKMDAAEKLIRMCGWEEETKVSADIKVRIIRAWADEVGEKVITGKVVPPELQESAPRDADGAVVIPAWPRRQGE